MVCAVLVGGSLFVSFSGSLTSEVGNWQEWVLRVGRGLLLGGRFELPRVSPYAPEAYASTNSAIRAKNVTYYLTLGPKLVYDNGLSGNYGKGKKEKRGIHYI